MKSGRDDLYAGFCACADYSGAGGNHPSRRAVACTLEQPTRTLSEPPQRVLSGLAPGGVYLASLVTKGTGGLLHHRFTLTNQGWRSVFCGTFPRVTPGGRYPPPCSTVPGRSSRCLRSLRLPGHLFRTSRVRVVAPFGRTALRASGVTSNSWSACAPAGSG